MPADLPCRLMTGGATLSENLIVPIPSVIEGTVLLSRTVLPPRGTEAYLPVAQSQPVAQIGGSVFVYRGRFEIPLASAASYAARANQLTELKRFDEAVADARKGIEIAPQAVQPHFALGLALSGSGQKEEARQALETAIGLMQSNPALYRNAEIRARRELERLQK